MPRNKSNARQKPKRQSRLDRALEKAKEKPNKKSRKRPQGKSSASSKKAASKSANKDNSSRSRSNSNRGRRSDSSSPLIGKIVQGKILLSNDKFAFVNVDQEGIPDVYVALSRNSEIMNKDTVSVKITQAFENGEKIRGEIISIVEHNQKKIFAVLRKYRGKYLAVPINKADQKLNFVLDSESKEQNIDNGTQALVEILEYPTKTPGTVKVLSIVNDINSPSLDAQKLLIENNWPTEFSAQALADAEAERKNWKPVVTNSMKDLRNTAFCTIDGADARDFDDAVYAEKNQNSYKLFVTIADVSSFVLENSQLEQEAYAKSTSVYYPNLVIPMLPEALSNDLCSLRPNEDKSSLCCEMEISREGKVVDYKFYSALINSKKRWTYTEFQKNWDSIEKSDESPENITNFLALKEVYAALSSARKKRYSIDLDIPEPQILIGSEGEVLDILKRDRLDAHRLIEECMLAANESASKFIFDDSERGGQGMYRFHDQPAEKKISELMTQINLFEIKSHS